MKKLIALLVIAIVLVGAVFAADQDKLVLESTVGQVKPAFKISGVDQSGTDNTDVTKVGSANGTTLETGKDITEDSFTWTFTVYQDSGVAAKPYCRYKGTIEVTVELAKFKNTALNAEQSVAPTVSAVTTGNNVADGTTDTTGYGKLRIQVGNTGSTSVKFTLTYGGKKVADQVIGTVTGSYTADPDLPMNASGTPTVYTADVTLKYSVQ